MKRLLILSILVLAALGSASAADAIKLKMVVWDLPQMTYMQPLLDAYKAKNPQVSIELSNIPSMEYAQKVAVMLAGGDDTDIISVKDMPMYAGMVAKSQLEPLNAYVAKDKVDLKAYSGIADQITVDKSLFALPYRSDVWILYYNKDAFDKAKVPYPTNDMTWDQYAALARKVANGEGVDRVYGSHYHLWRSTRQLPSVQDGKNTIITTDYSFMKPYYELVLGLQRDKTVMDFASLKVGNIHYSGVFFNGQIAMVPMGSWFIGTLIAKTKDGTNTQKNWGIVKYPHPAGVPAGTTAGTITSLAVNARSANKQAAWDFVKFVGGPEGAAVLAKVGTIPAIRNQAVLDSIKKIEGFPQDKNSAEALSTKTVRLELPMHPKAAIIEKILNEEDELIVTESKSIDAGLADMSRRVKEALAAQ
jgi:multiple sugar transport system substrate-binding protein